MSVNDWVQIGVYLAVLLILVKPLGFYMAQIFEGQWPGPRISSFFERPIYRLCGIDDSSEMNWKSYATAVLLFNFFGFVFVYALQRFQFYLPLNAQKLAGVSPDLALNTAISFMTNTNWQAYGGETTMSYFTQMAGLTTQNFVSAASGIAVLIALIRGITRKQTELLGNFWVDLTRGVLYILLPFSFILALALVSQGVIQNLSPYHSIETLENSQKQLISMGPAASQIAIKQLGTNGGGFFNANSAHPFENPTPLSNFLEMLAIPLISAALCYTFGFMIRDTKQGWALLAAMVLIFVPLLFVAVHSERAGNPAFASLGVDQATGNMEGKEVRFGAANSALWATVTTATSNGSVNSMHDSFMPLGGFVTLFMMQLGEVVFGGVGCGLYGMIAFVLVAVFVAGLMVGRTPEYLGKKIESFEMQMASVVILVMPAIVLGSTALAVSFSSGTSAVSNPGPHGFSQILYAFTSMGNNNGSAFAGLNANVPFYNILGGWVMLLSRFWMKIPILALAGSLARKKVIPPSAGTLSTSSALFVGLLIAVILIVGVLSFVPALALGPLAEHLEMVRI